MVLEKTLVSSLDCKEIQPVHPKGDQSWVFIGRTDAEAETPNTLATSCEELTHWKRPWCWKGLGAGGEGDDRGWDGWMASPTRWTWVCVNSGSWWWTGRPGVLQFLGSQRVRHNWATELNWTELMTNNVEHLFMCLLYLHFLFRKISVQVFCPFFKSGFCSCNVELYELFCMFDINPILVTSFANIFSNSVGYFFCQCFLLLCKSF